MDWSIVVGISVGLGLPTMTGLAIIVRMEQRVTALEYNRESDQQWRRDVTQALAGIARDVNRLIGKGQQE